MGRSHAWVQRGAVVVDPRPMNGGDTLTMIGATRADRWLTMRTSWQTAKADRFVAWVAGGLPPRLRPGDIVVLDNLGAHKDRRVRQLIFNFDPTLSNALKLPATVVLLHRFSEDLRDRKIAPEARNTEAGQKISISTRTGPDAKPLQLNCFGSDGEVIKSETIPITHARYLRAPSEPGFFRIRQGDELRSEERRVGKECRSRWSPYH